MADESLEQRVAAFEKKVEALSRLAFSPAKDDWRSTVGMFAGNAMMKEIDAEGRKIREADRRRARLENS